MATVVTVSASSDGSIGVRTSIDDGVPHRKVIHPGALVAGNFVQSDVSAEAPEVQELAAAIWTPEKLAAYEAFLRANLPPPPPSNDELDNAQLNGLLTQPGSVVRAIAEIQFGIIKGTIAIPQVTLTPLQYRALLKARMR